MYKIENNTNTIQELKLNSYSNLRKLQENVNKLDKIQQYEVYKIIKKFNNKLTENNNGIFINLTNLSDDCLYKINNFIVFSIENKKRLKKIEQLSDNIFKTKINNKKNDKINFKNDKNKNNNNNITKCNMIKENQDQLNKYNNLDKDYMLYLDENDENNSTSILNDMKKLDMEINEPNKEENEKIKDDYQSYSKKNNKFTGKRGRLFKKCKEINKYYNFNSLTNYNTYYFDNTNTNNDENSDNIIFSISELTEDKI